MSAPNSIQDAIKNYLAAHAWFVGDVNVPVYAQDEGDIVAKLNASLSKLDCGLAILVTTPVGTNNEPRSARVCLESIIEIQCFELPLISRATGGIGKTAYQAARVVASPFQSATKGLHGWNPACAGCGSLSFTGYVAETNESGGLLYSARFSFNETL